MKLYYSPTSPFVRKVLITAMELGIESSLERVALTVLPTTENQAFQREGNPLRKVPALLTDAGELIADSMIIVDYLTARVEGQRLLPVDGDARWEVQTRHSLANGVLDALVLVRYETALRPEDKRWQDWVDDQLQRADATLAYLDNTMSERRTAGEVPIFADVGDIAIACALGYLDLRFPERDWRAACPALAHWHERVATRESYRLTEPPIA